MSQFIYTVYFHLRVLYESDLRIPITYKKPLVKISELHTFRVRKQRYYPHYGFKGIVEIRAVSSFYEELHLQSL